MNGGQAPYTHISEGCNGLTWSSFC